MAYGLSRLDASDDAVADVRADGLRVLESLVEEYLVTDPAAPNYGAALQGCFDRPGDYATANELVWTNYYIARTLESLTDE